ncbi:MAG: hypothetical protein ACQES2_01965 [Pseudomonadota bacterium]
MKNLEIVYLYRDAANNKQVESVVIENLQGLPPEVVSEAIKERFKSQQCWPDIIYFQPEDLSWPTAYFDDFDMESGDLTVHELDAVFPTGKAPTHSFSL